MPDIKNTAFAELDAEGRLLSPVHKGNTSKPGRFGFRGEIALKFAQKLSDEARPPELKLDQVIAIAEEGGSTIPFLAGVSTSFEYLHLLCEVLGEKLSPDGKYFFFATNLDISKRYQVAYGGTTFWVLPLDEATVYNELLELFSIERGDLKKLDTGGKIDAIAEAAANYTGKFTPLTYEEGLKVMGPIKVKENRPV